MKDATRIGVYGASGSGKTTCVKALIRRAPRAVVFDPLAEYARGGWTAAHSLADVLAALKRGWSRGFRIAYVPPAGGEADALHRLALLLIRAQRPYFEGQDTRKLVLVAEELNLSFPVASLPRELYGFAELCSRGRHHGISIVGVSQRLAEINTRFRGNTEGAFFFRLADHTDAAVAARMLGPSWRDRLRGLRPHDYLYFANGAVAPGRNRLSRP